MDAVMRLETAGYVEIVSQVGCRVIVPSSKDLLDHLDVIIALAGAAGKLAAERATPEQLATIEDICVQLDEATAAGDEDAFDRLDIDFHNAVTAASDNPRLQDLVREAWDLSRFFRYQRELRDLPVLQAEHRAAFEAIKAANGQQAGAILERHHSRAKLRVGVRPGGH
jgi:DNA-binding GntR family transcriptional regulator